MRTSHLWSIPNLSQSRWALQPIAANAPTPYARTPLTGQRITDGSRKWSKDDDQASEHASSTATATRKIASRDALDSVQTLQPTSSRGSHEAESRRGEHVPHSICTSNQRLHVSHRPNRTTDQSHGGHRINSVPNISDTRRRLSITSQINGLPTLPFSPFNNEPGAPFFGSLPQKPAPGELPKFIKPLPSRIGPDEISYLEKKGALTVPRGSLRSEMLRAYVEFVHPYMPLLDLNDFLTMVDRRDGSNGKVSLILFQAVMFAGSAFVDMEHLRTAGYATRKEARKDFFQKTRVSQFSFLGHLGILYSVPRDNPNSDHMPTCEIYGCSTADNM